MKLPKIIITALITMPAYSADMSGWVSGVASGVDTLVNIASHIWVYSQDYEDANTTVSIDRYYYETTTSYPLAGMTYKGTWLVFIDKNGVYQYSQTFVSTGSAPTINTTPFLIGGNGGLPLTRRMWNCSQHTATTWYDANSMSQLSFVLKNTITKPATFANHAPATYETLVKCAGRWWNAVCGPTVITYSSWNNSTSVPRNGTAGFSYDGINIEIEDIAGKIKQ